MASQKYTSRKIKEEVYQSKYGHIPKEYDERLKWMIDTYNLSPKKMDEILAVRDNYMQNLRFFDLNIVLYEEPEGTGRPRFRIINRQNFNREAMSNGEFVHVYTLGAKDDHLFMKRLMGEELLYLDHYINTPCVIEYNSYFKTPSYYNTTQTFMAEIGLDRPFPKKPDWDNIGKKYCDMYNHNVWLDDAMVMEGTVRKFYSLLPRVEIKLRYLNCVYNRHQYNQIINRTDYDGGTISYLDSKGEIVNGYKQ